MKASAPAQPAALPSGDGALRPQARPVVLQKPEVKPPAHARTEEQFDTTSKAERKAAAAPPPPVGEQPLGAVVVSLGDVEKPGFWLETALVSSPAKGRVVFPATGKSAQVDLIPAQGGGRLSLAAMRLIEAPLTDLPSVEVFRLP